MSYYLTRKVYEAFHKSNGMELPEEALPSSPTNFSTVGEEVIQMFKRLIKETTHPIAPGSILEVPIPSINVEVQPWVTKGKPIIVTSTPEDLEPEVYERSGLTYRFPQINLPKTSTLYMEEGDYKDLMYRIDPKFSRLQYHLNKIKKVKICPKKIK